MINTYTFFKSPQNKLHEFIIAFFNTVEFETAPFSQDFFIKEFYDNLVSRHTGILKKNLNEIYDIIKDWKQADKSSFCAGIRQSNDIKGICEGKIIPWKESDIPISVRELTKTLFIKLYEDVLKGSIFKQHYGGRSDHYHAFKKIGHNNYEYCPACGMVEMKTYADKKTDQYDHYLSKDIYPFSSVNFENLVPVCIDCNSIEIKSNKDILSYTGKVFYPFDSNSNEINIEVRIKTNNEDFSKIIWEISYSCLTARHEEIESWKKVYNIEDRHLTHVAGRITQWYEMYDEFMNDKESIDDIPEIKQRANSYLRTLKKRKTLEKKSLAVLVNTYDLAAREEVKKYSRY